MTAPPPPAPARVLRHPSLVRANRRSSLATFALGVVGAVGAPLFALSQGLRPSDLVVFLGAYLLSMGYGLSVGYHRFFTHGAFQAGPAVRRFLAICGCTGGQGPPVYWVSVHRRHHELSDRSGDPHSPHVGATDASGQPSRGRLRGFWHGHFAWALDYGTPSASHYAPDLLKDPVVAEVGRQYRLWFGLGLVAPALAGGLLDGSWQGAVGGFLWGGLFRLFLSSHSTWSLNSFCHLVGRRTHETRDRSRNVTWLALPTLGESWHNNHHAFPSSARHGLAWWELDVNWLLIRLLETLGLARRVKRPKLAPVGGMEPDPDGLDDLPPGRLAESDPS